jgi:hypothetical protein
MAVCRHDFRSTPKLPPLVLDAFEMATGPLIGGFLVTRRHESRMRAS